jgi:hypothetical protein
MGDLMNQFDIFFAYVPYSDKEEGKDRPVMLLELTVDNNDGKFAPIYSYKKWFDNDEEVQKVLYEIQDLISAGLVKRSFIDVSRVFDVARTDLTNMVKIGHLSEGDISGLLSKFESL